MGQEQGPELRSAPCMPMDHATVRQLPSYVVTQSQAPRSANFRLAAYLTMLSWNTSWSTMKQPGSSSRLFPTSASRCR